MAATLQFQSNFRVADFIGEGAYGVVVRAQDTEGAADADNLGEFKILSNSLSSKKLN